VGVSPRSKQTGVNLSEEVSRLLAGLETMHDEVGPLAEELITLLRDSSATPHSGKYERTDHTGHKH
jgi:hypothetical protein